MLNFASQRRATEGIGSSKAIAIEKLGKIKLAIAKQATTKLAIPKLATPKLAILTLVIPELAVAYSRVVLSRSQGNYLRLYGIARLGN